MKNRYSFSLKFVVCVLLSWISILPAKAQFFYGLTQEFGKNRVQHDDFDWVFQRFERYDVYFYRGNDDLAAQVARYADKVLPQMEDFLDSPLDERIQILVFNNLSDLKQSNVNSNTEEDYNTSGVTRISGRRLFLHFNGSYADLEQQLRSGLGEVVLSNLVYGSFTQSIKNSTLLNLPEWYTEGLISYMGNPWDSDLNNKVKDGFLSGRYKRLNSLIDDNARYAGHSLWHYIAQTYGRKVIKNIVYMAIVNRNIENGFSYILGKDLETVVEGWKSYYGELYKESDRNALKWEGKPLLKVPKSKRIVRLALSEDGRHLAYVKQKYGEYKIYIKNLETGKRKRIVKGGYKILQNADYSYPLLAWHPNGEILAFITEEKGFNFLNFYNLPEKKLEKKKIFKFDKILSLTYSNDGKEFLLSAHKRGQSDIFIYNILNTKVKQLTNDVYDDLEPAFFDGGKRVVFSSNRPTDTLKNKEWSTKFLAKSFDLFAMPAQEPEKDTTVIWRLTKSRGINETSPKLYADSYIAFTSDRSGIKNRHLIAIDSSIAYVDTTTHYAYNFKEFIATNNDRAILNEAFSEQTDKIYSLVLKEERYRIFEREFIDPKDQSIRALVAAAPQSTQKQPPQVQQAIIEEVVVDSENILPLYYPGLKASDFEINIEDYQFDNENEIRKRDRKKIKPDANKVKLLPVPQTLTTKEAEEEELDIPAKRNYFLSFFKDDFSVGFDNIFSNPQYQRFTGFVTPDLLNFGFNANIKAGVIDIMHDYRIIGAVRTTFQPLTGTSISPNAEFYFAVSDYKDRLDIDYVFSRRSQVLFLDFDNNQRIITHEALPKFSWPLSPVASFRAALGYRIDKTISLSRETNSLENPDLYEDYIVSRLAYVYDNSRKIGLNLHSGLRYRIFAEYYRNLRKSPTGLYTAGIDLRHYTVIHRNLIWANRFASGVSFGPEKLLYIMGGVDNTFSSDIEPTPFADQNDYAFQTLITNMRGSFQNIRNGDKFFVINSEIRWPILSYLIRRPIRSDIFKNLQVIGFADVGTAWNGPSPYSEENEINTTEIPFGGSTIILNNQREPLVGGVGTGLRTRLFGYFLRFDWAWGIEDGLVKPRIFTFSLGTDF